eukprot:m.302474 g.302474  ORF g.302474 m.302474 type:complete len:309 (+) comp16435_c0_seq24:4200-5126(+)
MAMAEHSSQKNLTDEQPVSKEESLALGNLLKVRLGPAPDQVKVKDPKVKNSKLKDPARLEGNTHVPKPTNEERKQFANLLGPGFLQQAKLSAKQKETLGLRPDKKDIASSKTKDVFHPKLDTKFAKGHKLHTPWLLWLDEPDQNPNARNFDQVDWEDKLNKICLFGYVEEFWGLMAQIIDIQSLEVRSNYHLFRDGIKPMWEHERNKQGGKWVFNLPKRGQGSLNDLWLETMLLCIGECFGSNSEDVCGAVVSPRAKISRIALWTSDSSNEEKIMGIGQIFKESLEKSVPVVSLSYIKHTDNVSLYKL